LIFDDLRLSQSRIKFLPKLRVFVENNRVLDGFFSKKQLFDDFFSKKNENIKNMFVSLH